MIDDAQLSWWRWWGNIIDFSKLDWWFFKGIRWFDATDPGWYCTNMKLLDLAKLKNFEFFFFPSFFLMFSFYFFFFSIFLNFFETFPKKLKIKLKIEDERQAMEKIVLIPIWCSKKAKLWLINRNLREI